MKDTKVFDEIRVGKNVLSNRIVYAPTTRFRALPDHTPSDLELQYYDDRSKYPGSYLVTEATLASAQLGIYPNVPGIFTDAHVEAWKKITDRVHENKSFLGVQLWGLGRVGHPGALKAAGKKLIAPSLVYPDEATRKEAEKFGNPLHALTEAEIRDLIYVDYDKAVRNALAAGFDYIELHGAHGYLIDQFLHPVSNQRTDKYGGSIEKRATFVLELIDHLLSITGPDRLAIRLSPWAKIQGIQAENDEVHPLTSFSYVISQLQKRYDAGNRLAYLLVVEPRVQGLVSVSEDEIKGDNQFVKLLWKGVLMQSGNYTYDAPQFNTLLQDVDDGRTLVGFARYYTSNPDLVRRLRDGLPLTPYDRKSFYSKNNWGYNTWKPHGEEQTAVEADERQRKAQRIAKL